MKKMLLVVPLLALSFPVFASTNVSVNIGDPGFYGQIDIGNARPDVIYTSPQIIEQTQIVAEPVYLRVPRIQRTHWRQYCGQYNACNRRVYFVKENWYSNVYAPRYRQEHWHGGPDHRGHDREREHYHDR